MSKRKIFSREFKLEAIRSLDSGKKRATELARELGIPRSRLYAWRQQLQAGDARDAFPGHGWRDLGHAPTCKAAATQGCPGGALVERSAQCATQHTEAT